MLHFLESTPQPFNRNTLPGHFTASAFILDHSLEQFLLLKHTNLNRWLQPGGHSDDDPDPLNVARKEALEETSLSPLELLIPGIFDLDIHPIPANPKMSAHDHLDIRFLFRAMPQAAIQGNHESTQIQWVNLRGNLNEFNLDSSVLRMVSKTLLWLSKLAQGE
jgi:8-oxo-dGTP pyrophosphatase MutT (NUDIX family)